MNIGLIRMCYTAYGGAEVFLSRFIAELTKNGHTCHIFANKWNDSKSGVRSQESEVTTQGSKLIFHKVKTFGPSFLRLLSFAINSYLAVKEANLDIIVSFERTLCQDIYRAGDGCHKEWLAQRNKSGVRACPRSIYRGSQESGVKRIIKKILTFLNPLHLTLLYLEKRLFNSKKLKFVVANSNRGKEEIIRHYNLSQEKICVIYNGVDADKFDLKDKERIRASCRNKFGISANEIVLLFVGSGFERKGLESLIRAAGLLKVNGYDNVKLLVVGKGGIKKYYNLAKEMNIAHQTIFAGPLTNAADCCLAGDIFCLPSIYEPFSNACLEAMAAGLPVVTSRINGVSEILTGGEDGMIIENPADCNEIADKIKPLLNADKRNTMGKKARTTAEHYTIEKNVERFLKLINKVRAV